MKKNIQLILSRPCTMQWTDLKENGSGKYCDRCAKTIYDLTNLTDNELLSFFQHKKDHICGRVRPDQLNRSLNIAPKRPGLKWLMPLALSTAAFTTAQAQVERPLPKTESTPEKPASRRVMTEPVIPCYFISGQVVDSATNRPLSGVKIRKKDVLNVLALTDSDGRFELKIINVDPAVPYLFELPGQPAVSAYLKNHMILKMRTQTYIMLGGISTVSVQSQPLYLLVSGKKSCSVDAAGLAQISPDWIDKIDVLKDVKATAIYGAKAAHGVVIITIKKAFADRFGFSDNNNPGAYPIFQPKPDQ